MLIFFCFYTRKLPDQSKTKTKLSAKSAKLTKKKKLPPSSCPTDMPGLNSLPKPNTPESMSSFFNYFRNFPMSNFPGMGFPPSGQQMGFPPMSFPGMGFPPMSGQQMGFPPMSFPGMGFPPMSGQQMGFPLISFPHTTGIQLTGSQIADKLTDSQCASTTAQRVHQINDNVQTASSPKPKKGFQYCGLCEKSFSHLWRHFETKHATEPTVQDLKNLRIVSRKKFDKEWTKLRSEMRDEDGQLQETQVICDCGKLIRKKLLANPNENKVH